jgi:hypothetical protein
VPSCGDFGSSTVNKWHCNLSAHVYDEAVCGSDSVTSPGLGDGA